MTNANEPIQSIPDLNNHPSSWYGLTKREYFAAMAMHGLLANPDSDKYNSSKGITNSSDRKATFCCDMADALINALNETT